VEEARSPMRLPWKPPGLTNATTLAPSVAGVGATEGAVVMVGSWVGENESGRELKHAHRAGYAWSHVSTPLPNGCEYHQYVVAPVFPMIPCSSGVEVVHARHDRFTGDGRPRS